MEMVIKKIFVVTILFFCFVCFSANKIFASGEVIINEIMYDLEGSDDDYEWVEIKNISGTIVDLTGWKFNDGSNHGLNVPPKNGGQGSLVLSPNNFAVLADNAGVFLTKHPNFSGIVIDTVMSLNNTSDILKIIDSAGNIVDQVQYLKDWGASGNGYSLERVSDLSGTFCQSRSLGGSPNEVNDADCSVVVSQISASSTISPSPTATVSVGSITDSLASMSDSEMTSAISSVAVKLIITEFIPNPDGSDEENEWIEIYNAGDSSVQLKNWRLQDASGDKYVFSDEEIKPAQYLVLTRPITKLAINNDGETLSLISPNGDVASKIGYVGSSKEGFSFARAGSNDWRWTNILTPGKENEFSQSLNNKEGGAGNASEVANASTTNNAFNSVEDLQKKSQPLTKIIFLVIGIGFVFSIATLVFIKKVERGK